MSANDLVWGRQGGRRVDPTKEYAYRCINCAGALPSGRYLYCADRCSRQSRSALRAVKTVKK